VGDRPARLEGLLAVSGGKGITVSAAATISRVGYPIRLFHYFKAGISSLPIRGGKRNHSRDFAWQFRTVI
jgi:hypothetical protein